jgi:hypothetical protein
MVVPLAKEREMGDCVDSLAPVAVWVDRVLPGATVLIASRLFESRLKSV